MSLRKPHCGGRGMLNADRKHEKTPTMRLETAKESQVHDGSKTNQTDGGR